MNVNNRKGQTILRFGGFVAVSMVVVWGLFLVYLGTQAPTTPDEAAGRVYPYNYHGTVVFINLAEQILKYALPATGFLVGIALRIVGRHLKKNNKLWPPDDTYGD